MPGGYHRGPFRDLKTAEIAALLDVSERTVERYRHFARVWLRRELSRDATPEEAAT